MTKKYNLVFAADGMEYHFSKYANSEQDAINMVYNEDEIVNIKGVNHYLTVDGIYPIKDFNQVQYCLMHYTSNGVRPLVLPVGCNYISNYVSHCDQYLEQLFHTKSITKELYLATKAIPLIVLNDNLIIHAETGLEFGLNITDFKS
jgi:hypothetical protein